MEGYNLTLFEAMEKVLNGEGFMRGTDFTPGIYVKRNNDGTLMVVNGAVYHAEKHPLIISSSLRDQKFKVFTVANPKEIGIEQTIVEVGN